MLCLAESSSTNKVLGRIWIFDRRSKLRPREGEHFAQIPDLREQDGKPEAKDLPMRQRTNGLRVSGVGLGNLYG